MRVILYILVFYLSAGNALAAQVSPWTPDEVVKLVKEERLEGLKKVWKALGIESKLYDNSAPENVERFDEEIDGRDGIEVILRISDSPKWGWQYLIFSNRGEEWVFLGNVDYLHSYGPEHRIVTKGPQDLVHRKKEDGAWLVIKSDDFHGTGASLYKERWWDLSGDKLREALVYAVEGYVTGWGMVFDRDFGSKILGFDRYPRDQIRLYMAFWAIYYDGLENQYPDDVLFAVAKRVTYVWDQASGRFIIDPQLSEMTQEQVDGLYKDDSTGFLKHNLDELKKLASSKDESKRAWLKRFLVDCSDGPEKTVLLELSR